MQRTPKRCFRRQLGLCYLGDRVPESHGENKVTEKKKKTIFGKNNTTFSRIKGEKKIPGCKSSQIAKELARKAPTRRILS